MFVADHSLQNPSQLLRKQCVCPSGTSEGAAVGAGDGSIQINPNQAEEVQEWLVVLSGVLSGGDDGIAGGDVITCDCVDVDVSSS